MGRVPDLKNIISEDFDSKDRTLIDKLGFPINTFMQQVIGVLKNGIDFNNLNQQINTFTLTVDSTGKPTTSVQFKNNLKTKLIGIVCINAINKSGVSRFPGATPFISFTEDNKLVTVNNIAGLSVPEGQTNSDAYTITILSLGENIPTV